MNTNLQPYVIDKLAFEGPREPDRGYTMKASYLKEPHNGEAVIQVFKDGKEVRTFLWPAYKIYNLQAHFTDIVNSEEVGNTQGYEIAGWTGFPCVILDPSTLTETE